MADELADTSQNVVVGFDTELSDGDHLLDPSPRPTSGGGGRIASAKQLPQVTRANPNGPTGAWTAGVQSDAAQDSAKSDATITSKISFSNPKTGTAQNHTYQYQVQNLVSDDTRIDSGPIINPVATDNAKSLARTSSSRRSISLVPRKDSSGDVTQTPRTSSSRRSISLVPRKDSSGHVTQSPGTTQSPAKRKTSILQSSSRGPNSSSKSGETALRKQLDTLQREYDTLAKAVLASQARIREENRLRRDKDKRHSKGKMRFMKAVKRVIHAGGDDCVGSLNMRKRSNSIVMREAPSFFTGTLDDGAATNENAADRQPGILKQQKSTGALRSDRRRSIPDPAPAAAAGRRKTMLQKLNGKFNSQKSLTDEPDAAAAGASAASKNRRFTVLSKDKLTLEAESTNTKASSKVVPRKSVVADPDDNGYTFMIMDDDDDDDDEANGGGGGNTPMPKTTSAAVAPTDDGEAVDQPVAPRKVKQRSRWLAWSRCMPIIHPRSKFRQRWNLLILLLLTYYTFVLPFRVGFGVDTVGVLFVVETFFDITFLVDLYLNFFTGYYEAGVSMDLLVLNRNMIAKRYLRSWFALDFVSAFPVDLVLFLMRDDWNISAFKLGRLLRMLKLFRLLRILGLNRYMHSVLSKMKPGVARMFKFPIFVVISAHWLSCIFFWIAASSEDPSNAWTSINLVNNAALGDQYIASLYWSISSMTTVGYGDIVAISSEERLFSIATMLLASTFFAFFVGNMAHIISNVDATSAMYKSKMEFVSEFLAYQQLPDDLQSRIKSFYAHCWKRLSSFPYSEHHILGELSASLRREVVLYLNREMVEKVPFFHGQSDSFIANLILSMKIEICAPHDTIMQEGDIGHCMYFLRRGIVEVISGDGRTIFTTLSDGAFFGEVSLLVSGRRTASIRAVTHCDLLRLEQEDLNKALLDYPEAMHRITQLASDNKYQLSAKDQRVLRARFETIEKQMEADVNGRTDDDDDCEAEDYAGEDNDGDNDGDDNDNNDGGGGGGGGDRLRKSTTRRKSALEEGNTDMFFSIVDALRAKRSTASSLKSASMKSASMKSSSLMSRSSCPDQPPPA